MATPIRILGGIYVSSIEPLTQGVDLKKEYNISSILSVLTDDIPEEYTRNYNYKQISVLDDEKTNILQYFDEANNFIDEALFGAAADLKDERKRHKSSILVHCAQGCSRSVVVVAGYLMKKYKLDVKSSIYAIRRKKPDISPNDFFIEQLNLYNEIQSMDSPLYKQWKLELALKNDTFQIEDSMYNNTAAEATADSELRCKRCRQKIALSTSFVPHIPPPEEDRQSQFIKRAGNNRIIGVEKGSPKCTHFFVEPLDWMKAELSKGELEGKFCCPKCQGKVGAYSWHGSRCSCGKWMIPAIHLQDARVDEIDFKNSRVDEVKHKADNVQ
ncbi:hypothetical protein LJB42_000556 [Komagataella kurtzmanii]|nr:hypothetical protein LJB42_000556 [Komagataella kurtzmanii]